MTRFLIDFQGVCITLFILSHYYTTIDAIKEGVEIFDPTRTTNLRCDWSKKGIGFYLSQKHCDCQSTIPDCCENGWKITVCGSRFLHKNEESYTPIEGEALAVTWALDQTDFSPWDTMT